jgi:chromosome segregation ATPase
MLFTSRHRFSSQNGSGPTNPNVDSQLKRVREDYERKLSDMQSRLKKLQAAQQEHAKLVKSQSENERQLKALKSDLMEMKRNKVRFYFWNARNVLTVFVFDR